jgi:hypothetical protein
LLETIALVVVLCLAYYQIRYGFIRVDERPWYLYVSNWSQELTQRKPTEGDLKLADSGEITIYEFFEPSTMAVWDRGWKQIEHSFDAVVR